MSQEYSHYLKPFPCIFGYGAAAPFVLFGFRKNRALYSAQSPLIHSYGYTSDKRSHRLLSPIFPESEPFMNYPG